MSFRRVVVDLLPMMEMLKPQRLQEGKAKPPRLRMSTISSVCPEFGTNDDIRAYVITEPQPRRP